MALIAVADSVLKYDYLMILYQVVDESTVCLMGHERRQTLDMILELAGQVYSPEYDCSGGSGQETAGSWSSASSSISGHTWPSSASSATTNPSLASWSSGSCGQYSPHSPHSPHSPMSTSSTCSPSLSPKPAEDHSVPPPSVPHKFTVPPPTIAPPPPPPTSYHSAPPPPLTSLPTPAISHCISNPNIPTYEIVTSCQPSVIYSNGYYYTSFVPPSTTTTAPAPTPPPPPPPAPPCYTCSCSCGAPSASPAQWSVSLATQAGS